jgi:hypothetical protein
MRGFDEEKKLYKAKKEAKTSPYIGRYEVLPQFTNPPAAKAMKLLKRISTDPGILAIMKKYNWHVGTLKEMPPEGLVGVSEVCVLGYNQNMGQAIALRLRTDNLKGFRYYNVVMETMLHELCHMVHSEHDSKFWTLFRQLKREYESLDWTKSTAHTVRGGTFHPSINKNMENNWQDDSSDEEMEEESAHVLNPNVDADIIHQLNPRELAVEAATLRRMSQHNRDVIKEDPKTADPSEKMEIEPYHDHSHHSHSHVHIDNPSNTTNNKSVSNEPPTKPVPPKIEEVKKEPWECPSCHFHNEVTDSTCEVCQNHRLNVPAPVPDNVIGKNAEEIKTEIHTEQDLVNIHDSTANLGEKLEQAMNNFIVSVTGPEAKACLTTIFTICKNILENPNEQKFKSVPLANKNFNVKVGRFPKAIEIMKVIGFKEDPAKGVISFARNDPVLLWLAKSTVESKLSVL